MAEVILDVSISLDGFINDREGGVGLLYPDLAALDQTAAMQESIAQTGAVVMGRHAYDMGQDYTGYEYQVPIFVLTHAAPDVVAKGENDRLTFTFVTDGVASAIAQAKAAAGARDVIVIGGASTAQQCLRAGLLDEIRLRLMPVLLGGGTRLFEPDLPAPVALDYLGTADFELGIPYLRFRVRKQG